MAFKFFEDFSVGDTHNFSGRTVSKDDITRFAGEFDKLPFHLDEESAKRSIFGGLIASGLHTLSLAASIIVDELLIQSSMSGGLGLSEVRWLKPVRPGDSLSLVLTVNETERLQKPTGFGRVRVNLAMSNQVDAVVMTASVDYLFKCRG